MDRQNPQEQLDKFYPRGMSEVLTLVILMKILKKLTSRKTLQCVHKASI